MSVKIGIIGGSGLYKMGIIKDIEEIDVDTPFGKPSDKITLGRIDGVDVVFLPRHGKGHTIAPHKINYRANIFALKECGVEYLVSTAAVGSLKKELKPCDFVIAGEAWQAHFQESAIDRSQLTGAGSLNPKPCIVRFVTAPLRLPLTVNGCLRLFFLNPAP